MARLSIIHLLRIHFLRILILPGILLPASSIAQDSINRSNDFLIDTIPVVVPPAPYESYEEEKDDEYEDATVTVDEEEGERIYFLPFDSQQIRKEIQNYSLRKTRDSLVPKWKKDENFWYADISFTGEKEKQAKTRAKRSFFASREFEMLLTILAICCFVAILIWFIANNSAGIFRRNRQIERHEMEDEMPEDIFAISYEKEILKAEQKEDYRMATRLRFLQTLKNMADRNIIQYLQERTNLDYLMQLHQTSWYNDFFRITRHYEYSWYGKFEVRSDQYSQIKKDFESLYHKFH